MSLVLPDAHPARDVVPSAEAVADVLRIGIINIMPRLEAYEPLLLRRLGVAGRPVEPVFLRLETHTYTSSDRAHLDRWYRTPSEAGHLDGLILTGAPVEEVPFEEVRYWEELSALLLRARAEQKPTLGLCWGGLALGALLGVPKQNFAEKLFGVFEEQPLQEDDPIVAAADGPLRTPQSRHSGADDAALEKVASSGSVRLLAHSPRTGYGIFASDDHRFVAHLGHPEYEADRLAFEWRRDRAAGRTDVPLPHGLSVNDPKTTWQADAERFFGRWLGFVDRVARPLPPSKEAH